MFFGTKKVVEYVAYPVERDRHVTVTEQRAPTDQSVALLKEMQDAAKAALIDSVRVSNGVFDLVLQVERDAFSDQTVWTAVTQINGKRIVIDHASPRHEPASNPLKAVQEKLAEAIALELLLPEITKIAMSLRL